LQELNTKKEQDKIIKTPRSNHINDEKTEFFKGEKTRKNPNIAKWQKAKEITREKIELKRAITRT